MKEKQYIEDKELTKIITKKTLIYFIAIFILCLAIGYGSAFLIFFEESKLFAYIFLVFSFVFYYRILLLLIPFILASILTIIITSRKYSTNIETSQKIKKTFLTLTIIIVLSMIFIQFNIINDKYDQNVSNFIVSTPEYYYVDNYVQYNSYNDNPEGISELFIVIRNTDIVSFVLYTIIGVIIYYMLLRLLTNKLVHPSFFQNGDANIQKYLHSKKYVLICVISICLILLILLGIGYYSYVIHQENNNEIIDSNELYTLRCGGSYESVYEYENASIIECNNNLVYSIESMSKYSANQYLFGSVYEKEVEKHFPNGIYFFKESNSNIEPNELKIALESNSNQYLKENYYSKLYELVKDIASDYGNNLTLWVYQNKSFDDIESTYDKLFLNATYSAFYNMDSITLDPYELFYGDPENVLNSIFMNPDSYPSEARTAIKFNDYIFVNLYSINYLSYADFTQLLDNAIINYSN